LHGRIGNDQYYRNGNQSYNTLTHAYNGSPVIQKSPFGMTFENENLIRQHEKRKYKEDLDYLLNLKRQMNEDEFEKRYGDEFRRKVQLMNEVTRYKLFFEIMLIITFRNSTSTNPKRKILCKG